MDISGQYCLSQSRQAVWQALLDPAVLEQCIPGCQTFERLADDRYRASIKTAIGPVKATFTSELEITNANPPQSYRLEGQGKAGAVGFGRGFADVTLSEQDGGTVLSYTADFQVGGRLAQLGSRLVVGATRKIADEFFARLTATIDESAQRVEPKPPANRGKWIRVAAAVIVLGAIIWWLT